MRTDNSPLIIKLIHSYVLNGLKSDDANGINQPELLELQKRAEQSIYDSVRKEILNDLAESEKQYIIKQGKIARDKEKIKQISSLLGEGGLLAFFIGILVNQVSNWLTADVCPQGYSWKIILALLVLIIGVFGFLLYQSISRLLNLGEENESK